MKMECLLFRRRLSLLWTAAATLLTISVSNIPQVVAFSFQADFASPAKMGQASAAVARPIDIEDTASRDIDSFREWAPSVGIQMFEGLRVTQTPPNVNNQDGTDYSVYTKQSIPAGTPVIYVPASVTLSSSDIQEELGGNLEATESALESSDRLPLFRLMVKILTEFEKGNDSPFYPWLNALPRRFFNGVAMTDACFECLPPYASWLASEERRTFQYFWNAIQQGSLDLSEATIRDEKLVQWAYNVALTRHQIMYTPEGTVAEKKISPMADMLNHASFPNAQMQYDEQGNCAVVTTEDVPANSFITMSMGDTTNPTPLFAKYGFLYDDCPTIFCKAIHLQAEIEALGYQYNELLLDTQQGQMSPRVWDIFLYNLLQSWGPDAEDVAQGFYEACTTNDEDTKQSYHSHYFAYTLDAMQQFVNGMLQEVEGLTAQARSYDLETHPRVPIIVAHNNLVQNTFRKVKANLDAMAEEAMMAQQQEA